MHSQNRSKQNNSDRFTNGQKLAIVAAHPPEMLRLPVVTLKSYRKLSAQTPRAA
jgi:hypothetical protein